MPDRTLLRKEKHSGDDAKNIVQTVACVDKQWHQASSESNLQTIFSQAIARYFTSSDFYKTPAIEIQTN